MIGYGNVISTEGINPQANADLFFTSVAVVCSRVI